ncbi:hypothetical protein DERF_004371 [Dermatophagoides farinae]|uniref:Uncharacterized protein n=1 Tax=Dermatophagoides farinae TaxID=6954 RepID=A0A922L533_DERFA|nr:hypothetical protein DERF_004371 [Dermatophagoides farinae]
MSIFEHDRDPNDYRYQHNIKKIISQERTLSSASFSSSGDVGHQRNNFRTRRFIFQLTNCPVFDGAVIVPDEPRNDERDCIEYRFGDDFISRLSPQDIERFIEYNSSGQCLEFCNNC